MKKLSEKELVELTKVSSELAVRLIEEEIKNMSDNGINVTNEIWMSKRDSNIADAALIVSESFKALSNKLSDR